MEVGKIFVGRPGLYMKVNTVQIKWMEKVYVFQKYNSHKHASLFIGKLTFKNGVIYDVKILNNLNISRFFDFKKGHFQDNKFQGNGEYYFADGSKFVGAWDAGIPHGNGNYFDKQGHKWVGQFFNGSSKGLICEVM